MSYDPYNDPYNPVRKGGTPDLGSGNGGGNFEFGKGRDIPINDAPYGYCEGTTEATQAFVNWDKESGDTKATYEDYVAGPASDPDKDGD